MKKIVQKILIILSFCVVAGCFALLSYVIYHRQHAQRDLVALLVNQEKKVAEAFFSPDDHVADLLIDLIYAEQSAISMAIYTITDKHIAQALIKAHKRGIKIEGIVDPGYGDDRFSKVWQLANAGIPLWSYNGLAEDGSSSLMHNKFCIFQKNIENRAIVWTGSFNFTTRANGRNQENVVILDDKHIIEKFVKQFDILKNRSTKITQE